MVYLQRCHGDFVHKNNPVGARLPTATTGTGWAYLAGTSERERKDILDAIRKADPKAWVFFQQLAPTYRRHFVAWIHIAKRPETRAKRLRESIELLAAGKKLGLK